MVTRRTLPYTSNQNNSFLLLFPVEDGTVETGGVRTGKVHGVGTAGGGTLAQIAMVLQRIEHEVVVKVVLPDELLSL